MKINKVLRKMKLTPNYVLLVHVDEPAAKDPQGLRKALEDLQIPGLFMIVNNLENVRALPEIEMNQYGWYRIESLRGKILREKAPDVQKEEEDGKDNESAEREV